jgi:hypothetical protein
MATQFSTLYGEVNNQFDTTTASSGRTKLWTNWAQHWFLSKRKWSFLETVVTVASVSGTADYVLAGTAPIVTDFDGLIDARHNLANAGATFAKLRYMQQQDFDDCLAVAGATPGIPVFYTLRGGTPQTTSATILSSGNQALSVWPVPNYIGSFKLAYFRSVASCEMTADTDVSIVPLQYQQAVVARAVAYGLATKDQMIQSNVMQGLADNLVAEAIAADTMQRTGDQNAETRPQIQDRMPPTPAIGANPALLPYGYGTAA